MSLFSNLDWVILLAVGAFLLLGKENGAFLRQIGRYYGRLARLKTELLSDFAKAADLPAPTSGRPLSLRTAFVAMSDPAPGRTGGIPVAVSVPPQRFLPTGSFTPSTVGAVGVETWSVAIPAVLGEGPGP